MSRFVATDVTFRRTVDGMTIYLANAQGLRDIAFTVPPGYAPQGRLAGLAYRGADRGAAVYAVTDDRKVADIRLSSLRADGPAGRSGSE
jgi:hypothetical protein